MAISFAALSTFPQTKTHTVGNTTVTEVTIPVNAKKVSLGSQSATVYISSTSSLSDGDSVPVADYAWVPSGSLLAMTLGIGVTHRLEKLYVWGSAGSTVVHIIFED